jgi:arginase
VGSHLPETLLTADLGDRLRAMIRQRGPETAARDADSPLQRPELAGVWVHLDCDAVDDSLMPAVDYRLPDGLSWTELGTVLRLAVGTGRVVGLEITIFNPALDQTAPSPANSSTASLMPSDSGEPASRRGWAAGSISSMRLPNGSST